MREGEVFLKVKGKNKKDNRRKETDRQTDV
jgi:hypothetical protein